jgi:hypothetical protein
MSNFQITEFNVFSATFDDKFIASDSILSESNAGEITADSTEIEADVISYVENCSSVR